MIKRSIIAGVAAVIAVAALAGCVPADAPTDSQRPASTEQPTSDPAPPAAVRIVEGDIVKVPAVEDWGPATVHSVTGGSGPVTRLTVDFEAVPIGEFVMTDTADDTEACTVVAEPDLNEIRGVRIDAPNGAGAVFEDRVHGVPLAELVCVHGDTPLLAKLDAAKERVFAEGTVTYRAVVRQDEVVVVD